jgi:hypothetical protein
VYFLEPYMIYLGHAKIIVVAGLLERVKAGEKEKGGWGVDHVLLHIHVIDTAPKRSQLRNLSVLHLERFWDLA